MPEPTGASQEGAPGSPPAGDPPPAPAAGVPSAAPAAAPTDDPAILRRELEEARREAAGYRTRLKTFEDGQKTEAEKTAERIKELEATNASLLIGQRTANAQRAATAAARKAGFWDPELAFPLIAEDVQFDESGSPKNVESLITALAKDKPRLVNGGGQPQYGGGHRGDPAAGVDMNALIRQRTGRT